MIKKIDPEKFKNFIKKGQGYSIDCGSRPSLEDFMKSVEDERMSEEIKIDSYEPDYKTECCVCGQSPVVTAVKDGSVLHSTEMCGPCTWGEAETIDPDTWNEDVA